MAHAALGQGAACGLGGEIAGGDAFVHDVAFADAGALHDPVVGSFHQLFQIVVGQQARRNISTQGSNLGAHQLAHSISLQVQKTNSYFDARVRQCPTAGSRRSSVVRRQISLTNADDCSRYPSTCPCRRKLHDGTIPSVLPKSRSCSEMALVPKWNDGDLRLWATFHYSSPAT